MSGDKQLLTFMLRYMKYLHDTLRVRSLSAEDAMHTADTMEAGILLYNITGQKAILSVLMMLVSQGADYTSLFHAFPYRTPISRSFTAQELLDALAHEDESGYTHHLLRSASGANLCEGLRVSALCGVLTGSGKHLSAPEAGLARLNKAHGAAGGGVTADPLLGGTHPSRGVSAVSACELAASLETLLACPGGEFGADQLETLMYNTIDAAFSPDGRGVQPMQQANQAMLSRAARFPLCGEDAGLFSLEDGDALCSLLSAWPRFVQAQWMISRDDGLCAMAMRPARCATAFPARPCGSMWKAIIPPAAACISRFIPIRKRRSRFICAFPNGQTARPSPWMAKFSPHRRAVSSPSTATGRMATRFC